MPDETTRQIQENRAAIYDLRKEVGKADNEIIELRQKYSNLHSDKNMLVDEVDAINDTLNGNGVPGIKTRVSNLENAIKNMAGSLSRSGDATKVMFGWLLVIQLAMLSGLIVIAVRG